MTISWSVYFILIVKEVVVDDFEHVLDKLGKKYGSDKSSSGHDYLKTYDRLFVPWRHKEITLLEIGVFNGASITCWEEYFSKAKIVGVDIDPKTKSFERGRVKIENIDQSNVEDLARIALEYGPFDIIIDDGSHYWNHQITSLIYLFPFLKSGGFYVIEDLQTNFGRLAAEYRGVANESCMAYLKKWADLLVGHEESGIEFIDDPFLRTYGREIYYISFFRHMAVINKKNRG